MEGLGRVEEVGRGAGGAERGCDLAGDKAGLADTGDDDAVRGRGAGFKEGKGLFDARAHGGVEADGEGGEGGGLGADEGGGGVLVRAGEWRLLGRLRHGLRSGCDASRGARARTGGGRGAALD